MGDDRTLAVRYDVQGVLRRTWGAAVANSPDEVIAWDHQRPRTILAGMKHALDNDFRALRSRENCAHSSKVPAG
eukprot:3197606-Pyramimonas_sp.AAC.1